MLKVGLTGGMACGKTAVAEMFARRGAHVIQADRIAHEVMQPGQPVYDGIVRHFGREILANDGSIDRAKLAQAAFGSPSRSTPNALDSAPATEAGSAVVTPSPSSAGSTRIEELNRIVHPVVIRMQNAWMDDIGRREGQAIAIVEAALIFEADLRDHFDRIVVVTCAPEQKVERFARRANMSVEEARRELGRRSAAQWTDEAKASRADYVIDNSGSLEATERQVEQVWQEMKAQATK